MNDPETGCGEYRHLITDCLGLAPWDTVLLWKAHAVSPIRANAVRWAAHVAQASLKAEPRKHHHLKLMAVEEVAVALDLTRPRMRQIFGSEPCALPARRMVDSAFTSEERLQIRELSRRTGYTKRWIKELALRDGGEVDFCDWMLAFELSVLPTDVLDRMRPNVRHISDGTMTRHVRRYRLAAKPGPKSRTDTVELQVAKFAYEMRWSVSKTYRKIRASKAVTFDVSSSENVELPVTMTVNSCHDDSEFPRSVTSAFSTVFHTESGKRDTDRDSGYSATEIAIANVAMTNSKAVTKRRKYNPDDISLLTRWYADTRGKTLTSEIYRQWSARNSFDGYLATARLWQSNKYFLAKEVEFDRLSAHIHNVLIEVSDHAADATRYVRGSVAHSGEEKAVSAVAEVSPDGS